MRNLKNNCAKKAVVPAVVGVVGVNHKLAVHFARTRVLSSAFTDGARDGAGSLVFVAVAVQSRVIRALPGVTFGVGVQSV